MGVSPRRLLGFEPAEMTTYQYDGAGRIVSTLTVREPEFSEWDLAVLLADRDEAERPRGPHGLLLEEATDPRHRGKWHVERVVDFAEQALTRHIDAQKKKYPDADFSGSRWRVFRADD